MHLKLISSTFILLLGVVLLQYDLYIFALAKKEEGRKKKKRKETEYPQFASKEMEFKKVSVSAEMQSMYVILM